MANVGRKILIPIGDAIFRLFHINDFLICQQLNEVKIVTDDTVGDAPSGEVLEVNQEERIQKL